MADKYTFKDVHRLYYWCNKVLPTVYDDSLSYYELLNKIALKLNTLIENYNELPEYIVQEIAEMLQSEELGAILQGVISNFMLNVKYPPAGITPAVGDGATDDTEAIQGCIDWAAENGGGAVYIPAGWYLTESITLRENVSLVGYDRYATVFTLKGGATEPLVTAQGANTIAGITLNANTAVQTEYQNALTLSGEDHIVRNVILDGGNYGLEDLSSGHLQLTDIIVPGCVIAGMYIHGSAQVQAENVMVETVSEIAGDASYIINNNNGTYQIGTIARVDEGVVINGNDNYVQLRSVNAVTDFTDSGTNNQILVETKTDTLYENRVTTIENSIADIQSDVETLTENLQTETSNRETADAEILVSLGEETTARENADTALNTAITAETTARTAADTAITDQINTLREDVERAIDTTSYVIPNMLVGDIMSSGQPCAVCVYGGYLYTVEQNGYDGNGTIYKFDIQSNMKVGEYYVKVGHGNSMCFNEQDNYFYIAPIATYNAGTGTFTNRLYRYSTDFQSRVEITTPGYVQSVTFDTVTQKMYIGCPNQTGDIITIYEMTGAGTFTEVLDLDVTNIKNEGSAFQDLAINNNIIYANTPERNFCSYHLEDGAIIKAGVLNFTDADNVWRLGEAEGLEFDEHNRLYMMNNFVLNGTTYTDSHGVPTNSTHGVIVEIPLNTYVRKNGNINNLVHNTLIVDGQWNNRLLDGNANVKSPELLMCRVEHASTYNITGNITLRSFISIGNVNINVQSGVTVTVSNPIAVLSGIFGLRVLSGGQMIFPDGSYGIECQNRPVMLTIHAEGTISGSAASSDKFVRVGDFRVPLITGALTGFPNAQVGINNRYVPAYKMSISGYVFTLDA